MKKRQQHVLAAALALTGAWAGAGEQQQMREQNIVVSAGAWAREDYPVVMNWDRGGSTPAVTEIAPDGTPLDTPVPCQVSAGVEGQPELAFIMPGRTEAGAERRFRISADGGAQAVEPVVRVEDGIEHQGQVAWRITTPGATYVFHQRGAGFASLYDAGGRDWLSYRPSGGSAGNYRGIPNACHPEGYFHPGSTNCVSRLVADGPARVTIAAESDDGTWACRWDIFPRFARLTMLRTGHPYWFLYEGTPGGRIEVDTDWVVRSDGYRAPASESWKTRLASPQWVAFGDGTDRRALFLACLENDEAVDSYWPMEKNMTVFGFGREGMDKQLTRTPYRFAVGLVPPTEPDADLAPYVMPAMAEVEVRVDAEGGAR